MRTNKSISGYKVTELILELSADAHVQRREVSKDSAAFQTLTGAIAAYGKVLEGLTILQQSEELFTLVSQHEVSDDAVMAERLSYVA